MLWVLLIEKKESNHPWKIAIWDDSGVKQITSRGNGGFERKPDRKDLSPREKRVTSMRTTRMRQGSVSDVIDRN